MSKKNTNKNNSTSIDKKPTSDIQEAIEKLKAETSNLTSEQDNIEVSDEPSEKTSYIEEIIESSVVNENTPKDDAENIKEKRENEVPNEERYNVYILKNGYANRVDTLLGKLKSQDIDYEIDKNGDIKVLSTLDMETAKVYKKYLGSKGFKAIMTWMV